MQNEIMINASAGETRVAILEQGHFAELHIERERDRSVAGMVVLGRVTRVLPGMQAAFVDIGLEKAAFLYVGDYLDESAAHAEIDDEEEPVRAAAARRGGRNGQRPAARRRSRRCCTEGQEIVVQVAKEPDRHQGRAHHLPRLDRRPPPGADALGPARRASRGASTRIASAGGCARS